MGVVCDGDKACSTSMKARWIVPLLLYAGFLAALCFSIWSILRADSFREQTERIHNQASEVQWRASESREKVAQIKGYLELAESAGVSDPRLLRAAKLLNFNLKALARLDYAGSFITDSNMHGLHKAIKIVENVLLPAASKAKSYDLALRSIATVEMSLAGLSSAAVDHSQALSATAHIAIDAARNRLIFFAALSALLLSVIAIHQYNKTTREKDQHIKSFSLLFAHMTRTRIAALRLFLGYLDGPIPPPLEMTDAAMRTVVELDSINEGLMIIGHARHQAKLSPLGRIISDIARGCQNTLAVDADIEARETLVPASQFHLLIDELVRNATNAVAGREDQVITISAVIHQRFLRRPLLILTVSDNGSGMTQELLAKVREPFFSTKAGKHVGLGLTNCVELMKTMAGKLEISSKPGAGTSVRITYSVR
jgi:signal transduction histidine kinase